MKKTTIICDLCKNECYGEDLLKLLVINRHNGTGLTEEYDLCEDCRDQIKGEMEYIKTNIT